MQACRLFLGTWNFRSFASLAPAKGPNGRIITDDDLIKTIYKFSFSKTKIENKDFDQQDYNYYGDSIYNKLDFFDFHVEGKPKINGMMT